MQKNTLKTLKSSYEIYKALGSDYQRLINKYDRKKYERNKTTKAKQQLNPYKCAACGTKQSLVAAHITPLAECATTETDNLIFFYFYFRI